MKYKIHCQFEILPSRAANLAVMMYMCLIVSALDVAERLGRSNTILSFFFIF
jgi:hypothetical protein